MPSNYIPQVDYTSRDYASIRDSMVAQIPNFLPEWTSTDASDFGITLIELFSYMGDALNYYIDRAANEGFIATATQKQSVLSIAQLLGYTPSAATPANVLLTFTNRSSNVVVLPALTQVTTTTVVNGLSTQVIFETDAAVTIPLYSTAAVGTASASTTVTLSSANAQIVAGMAVTGTGVPAGTTVASVTSSTVVVLSASVTLASVPLTFINQVYSAGITATQGKTIFYEQVGVSTGAVNQAYSLAQSPLIAGSSTVVVGTLSGGVPVGVSFTEVPYIIDASYNTPAYSVSTDSNNISYINFGDGVSGRIPPANSVFVTYRVGGGSYGNVGPSTLTNQITNVIAGISVTNAAAASGGADAETTDSIRINAPLAYSALNRAVSLSDYASLSVGVPSVAKAIADSSSSANSIVLYLAPFGDQSLGTPGVDAYGNNTTTFTNAASTVTSYLQDKSPATTTVTLLPAKYVPISVTVSINLLPQYRQSIVSAAINLALSTFLSFNSTIFSENITLQALHNILSQVDGVDYVNVTLMTRSDAHLTGSLTATSPTITSPSSVLNLTAGQYVAFSPGAGGTVTIPAATTISSINTATATITAASATGGVITYTATNSFIAGQPVTITGVNPTAYNISGVIATATGSSYTVNNTTVSGTYASGGTATAVVSLTMSANATGTGSTTAASLWTSSLATTGVNNVQCGINEIPVVGTFTISTSGGILS